MEYYIFGNEEKEDQIRAAFEGKGYSDDYWNFSTGLYYTMDGSIHNTSIGSIPYTLIMRLKEHGEYVELKLPIKPKFRVGEKIHRLGGYDIYNVCSIDEETQEYGVVLDGTYNRVKLSFEDQDKWSVFVETEPKYEVGQLVVLEDSLIGMVSDIQQEITTKIWLYKIGTFNRWFEEGQLSAVPLEKISKILGK